VDTTTTVWPVFAHLLFLVLLYAQMTYLGAEDLHDLKYDNERRVIPLYNHANQSFAPDYPGQCFYSLHVYPTATLEGRYLDATTANVLAAIVVLVFVAMVVIFAVYDHAESTRNRKVVATAAKANQIVQSMFPSMVQSRLFDSEKDDEEVRQSMQDKTKTTLRSIMDGGDVNKVSKPIADLYPHTTIMFADMKGNDYLKHVPSLCSHAFSSRILVFFRALSLSGFTAWSSVRQPSEVFHLLETVYASFDEIAKRRRIFKVEYVGERYQLLILTHVFRFYFFLHRTIGDCYVAVCGLPDPRKNHALLMCRFARDCLHAMRKLVMEMSDTLGPDTLELKLRIGLHSGEFSLTSGKQQEALLYSPTFAAAGPVTAGVLRGDRARFQLFGKFFDHAVALSLYHPLLMTSFALVMVR
jgi:hypothetical protein